MLAWLFALLRTPLAYSYGVLSIEAKNLAKLKLNYCSGVANLKSIEFHASLFNQARGFAAGFLDVKSRPIDIQNERNGFQLRRRSR